MSLLLKYFCMALLCVFSISTYGNKICKESFKTLIALDSSIHKVSLAPPHKDFVPYLEALRIVQSLSIQSKRHFFDLKKGGEPALKQVPSHPDLIYKKQWKGWYRFLGKREPKGTLNKRVYSILDREIDSQELEELWMIEIKSHNFDPDYFSIQ